MHSMGIDYNTDMNCKCTFEDLELRQMYASDWHNAVLPCDADRSRLVTPLDALVVINVINRDGSRLLPTFRLMGRSIHKTHRHKDHSPPISYSPGISRASFKQPKKQESAGSMAASILDSMMLLVVNWGGRWGC